MFAQENQLYGGMDLKLVHIDEHKLRCALLPIIPYIDINKHFQKHK